MLRTGSDDQWCQQIGDYFLTLEPERVFISDSADSDELTEVEAEHLEQATEKVHPLMVDLSITVL